jgi:hypothetical protein
MARLQALQANCKAVEAPREKISIERDTGRVAGVVGQINQGKHFGARTFFSLDVEADIAGVAAEDATAQSNNIQIDTAFDSDVVLVSPKPQELNVSDVFLTSPSPPSSKQALASESNRKLRYKVKSPGGTVRFIEQAGPSPPKPAWLQEEDEDVEMDDGTQFMEISPPKCMDISPVSNCRGSTRSPSYARIASTSTNRAGNSLMTTLANVAILAEANIAVQRDANCDAGFTSQGRELRCDLEYYEMAKCPRLRTFKYIALRRKLLAAAMGNMFLQLQELVFGEKFSMAIEMRSKKLLRSPFRAWRLATHYERACDSLQLAQMELARHSQSPEVVRLSLKNLAQAAPDRILRGGSQTQSNESHAKVEHQRQRSHSDRRKRQVEVQRAQRQSTSRYYPIDTLNADRKRLSKVQSRYLQPPRLDSRFANRISNATTAASSSEQPSAEHSPSNARETHQQVREQLEIQLRRRSCSTSMSTLARPRRASICRPTINLHNAERQVRNHQRCVNGSRGVPRRRTIHDRPVAQLERSFHFWDYMACVQANNGVGGTPY